MITIFDVDGVLIDTTTSYHLAILETIKKFTKNPNIDLDEVLDIKYSLGINNDWDASVAGIIYVISGDDLESFKKELKKRFKSLDDLYKLADDLGIKIPDYQELINVFDNFYYEFRNTEKPIFSEKQLEEIKKLSDITGVITGRPKKDLDFTFKLFDLYKYFDYIITESDIPKPKLRKPSPYPLELFFSKYNYSEPSFYIGDTSADKNMVESFNKKNNKNVNFILFRPSSNLEHKYRFENPEEVLEFLKSFK